MFDPVERQVTCYDIPACQAWTAEDCGIIGVHMGTWHKMAIGPTWQSCATSYSLLALFNLFCCVWAALWIVI